MHRRRLLAPRVPRGHSPDSIDRHRITAAATGARRPPALARGALLTLLLALALVGAGATSASVLAQAIGSWEYDQIEPAAAYNASAGEYLVVWEDHHWGYGDNWDIYGRRVAGNGAPLGSMFGISWDAWAGADNHRLAPDVAYNSVANEYLVVIEYAYSDTDHDILARRVAANGTLPGADLAIATSTRSQSRPSVAYNPVTNTYLVVYEELIGSDEFAYKAVYGVLVSAVGNAGTPFAISSGTMGAAAPDVAYGQAAGQYLVVWQDRRAAPASYDILGQRVTAAGALTGSPILVGAWDADQLLPGVTYNGDAGEFLVVWEDHHWGDANGSDIYGQRVGSDGSLRGGFVPVANHATRHMTRPDVAYNAATRNYLVIWDYVYSATDHDVYARRVAYDGTQPDTELAISNTGYQERTPAVAAGSGSTLLMVWEDSRNAGMGYDVYGELFTITLPALSGGVYDGAIGDTSTPLRGVTVALYCSNNTDVLGTLVGNTTTAGSGAYSLTVPGQCEYYNIQESDPAGYTSVGPASVSGIVKSSNWIQYTHPLAGKTWTANNFWDTPVGPVDDLPPGNWTSFSPADWVNVRNVPVSVRVEDTLSGLNTASASYAYYVEAAARWSDWEPAACTGTSGTTAPQTISATVPYEGDGGASGPNRVRFRIADMAGNVGTSGEYVVKIDTVTPANPTSLTSPSHMVNVWSRDATASTTWSGASDDRSGIAGYAYAWDHAPATVPTGWDTAGTSVNEYPLSDAGDWWFHVRSYDAAGNAASGAVHLGPIRIDTGAPTAWLTAPASGIFDHLDFNVAWYGGDVLSGVASYDVQTSLDGTTWSTWLDDVSLVSAGYIGQRGNTVRFRVLATDWAGNVSPWSSTVQVTLGVTVTARVRNDSGAAVSGASVYRDGTLMGATNASGLISVPYALLGDELVARKQVYEHPAAKPDHGWSYRVYQTSVRILNDGTPELYVITNTGAAYQDLTVRPNQAAIGFHVLVWVEWDASPSYLAGLTTGIRQASEFLYDVTDGQLYWEQIDVYDNGQYPKSGDFNIYASNAVWPNAFIGAIQTAHKDRIYLPRMWDKVPWSTRNGSATMIHEFGHYALYLYDEYLDRDGKPGGFCTHNRGTGMEDEPTRASIMDNQGNSSELCSSADPAHAHNTNTHQHAENNGETTWATVMRIYSDSQVPSRWTLQSPDTRFVPVVAGPVALPVQSWMNVTLHDVNTNVCAPFMQSVVFAATGLPAPKVEITLDRPLDADLYQGLTDATGQIEILGAHPGDVLRAKLGDMSGSWTVNCTPGGASALGEVAAVVGLAPDPYQLAVTVVPLAEYAVQVRAQASTALPAAPEVVVWQTGAAEPIIVAMGYEGSPGLYTGTAALNPTLEPQGYAQAAANDGAGGTVWAQQGFHLQPAIALDRGLIIYSSDNNMGLVLPAGALQQDAVLAIVPVQAGATQCDLVQVGLAYQIIASTGQTGLNLAAIVNARYPDPLPPGVLPESLRLYRWHPAHARWLPAGEPLIDPEHRLVGTEVAELGIYALFGGAPPGYAVYLPLVMR